MSELEFINKLAITNPFPKSEIAMIHVNTRSEEKTRKILEYMHRHNAYRDTAFYEIGLKKTVNPEIETLAFYEVKC
jgi:hypothetical protein